MLQRRDALLNNLIYITSFCTVLYNQKVILPVLIYHYVIIIIIIIIIMVKLSLCFN